MSENKIPTVSEFTKNKLPGFLSGMNEYGVRYAFEDLMIEFAKIHVKAALEAAKETTAISKWSEEDQCCVATTNTFQISLCYPPENIK